jgi:hypothetical protein
MIVKVSFHSDGGAELFMDSRHFNQLILNFKTRKALANRSAKEETLLDD